METTLINYALTTFIGLILGWIIAKFKAIATQNSIKEQLINIQKEFELLQISYTHQSNDLKNQQNSHQIALEKLNQRKEEIIDMIRTEKEEFKLAFEKTNIEKQFLTKELQTNQQHLEKIQAKFSQEFENLATKILEEKSKKFTIQNQENIHQLLQPLQEKIVMFENKVENTHKESIDYHAALRQQIIGLKELNEQMNKETINLTKALKGDVKMQGNWGEFVCFPKISTN